MKISTKKPRRELMTSPIVVGSAFTAMGVLHLVRPAVFDSVIPHWVPMRARTATLVSGWFEILGGLGMINPSTRRIARSGLVALLAGVFPANVHMAQHPQNFAPIPAWALYARLPLQPLMAWQVWRAGAKPIDD